METASPASRIQANLQDLFKANLAPGDAYIRFQLTSSLTALLAMKQVQGSLIIEAEKITPLPSMPASVIGIISFRDRVFCLFDLAQLLTLPNSLTSPRQYQIIVLQTTAEQPMYFGLAVNHLQRIVRLPKQQIQSSLVAFPEEIAPYLCGVVPEEESIIPVLDFNSISQALTTVNI